MIQEFPLNSNLILLIRISVIRCGKYGNDFKFQSDSINTKKAGVDEYVLKTLNSNLILLIQGMAKIYAALIINFKFQSDSINTEMIRLINDSGVLFKFQSDSINTVC